MLLQFGFSMQVILIYREVMGLRETQMHEESFGTWGKWLVRHVLGLANLRILYWDGINNE